MKKTVCIIASVLSLQMLGQTIKQLSIDIEQTIVDLSDLSNGVYIIEINTTQYQTKQKLIINK